MPALHHLVFYRPDALPAAQPTSVNALIGLFAMPHLVFGINSLLHSDSLVLVSSSWTVFLHITIQLFP